MGRCRQRRESRRQRRHLEQVKRDLALPAARRDSARDEQGRGAAEELARAAMEEVRAQAAHQASTVLP